MPSGRNFFFSPENANNSLVFLSKPDNVSRVDVMVGGSDVFKTVETLQKQFPELHPGVTRQFVQDRRNTQAGAAKQEEDASLARAVEKEKQRPLDIDAAVKRIEEAGRGSSAPVFAGLDPSIQDDVFNKLPVELREAIRPSKSVDIGVDLPSQPKGAEKIRRSAQRLVKRFERFQSNTRILPRVLRGIRAALKKMSEANRTAVESLLSPELQEALAE